MLKRAESENTEYLGTSKQLRSVSLGSLIHEAAEAGQFTSHAIVPPSSETSENVPQETVIFVRSKQEFCGNCSNTLTNESVASQSTGSGMEQKNIDVNIAYKSSTDIQHTKLALSNHLDTVTSHKSKQKTMSKQRRKKEKRVSCLLNGFGIFLNYEFCLK